MSEPLSSAPKPSVQQRKTMGLILLGISVGAMLRFAMVLVLNGPPPSTLRWIYLWPSVGLCLCAFAIRDLKRCYREAPETFTGHWHLSIVDLYAVTFFTALLMALNHGVWPDSFIPVGIAISFGFAFAYLGCLLFTARIGYTRPAQKCVRALTFLMIGFGWMSTGAFAAGLAYQCIVSRNFPNWDQRCVWIEYIFFFAGYPFVSYGVVIAQSEGVASLLIGLLLQRLFRLPAGFSMPASLNTNGRVGDLP